MKDCKIRTYGIEEYSERVQKRLFELGCEWSSGLTDARYLHSFFLFVRNNEITKDDDNEIYFNNDPRPEVTLQDLIDMQPEKKKRQEKFYQWAYLSGDSQQLTSTKYLYSEKGKGLEKGKFYEDATITRDILQGKAWKLNPDNPVILEVEE